MTQKYRMVSAFFTVLVISLFTTLFLLTTDSCAEFDETAIISHCKQLIGDSQLINEFYLLSVNDEIATVVIETEEQELGILYYSCCKEEILYICNPGYGTAFCAGYAACCDFNRSIVIDTSAMPVVELPDMYLENAALTYESIFTFSSSDGLFKIYNAEKKQLTQLIYDIIQVDCFSDGMALFQDRRGLYGYIDATGSVVVPAQYSVARDYIEGRAVVVDGCDYFIIDQKGIAINSNGFANAFGYSEGLCGCVTHDGKIGFVDRDGGWVFQPEFDNDGMKLFKGGIEHVQSNGRYYQISTDGTKKEISYVQYEALIQ